MSRKITKKDIRMIAAALKKAEKAQEAAFVLSYRLQEMIVKITGVNGFVDHLYGDGFGFTPESNNDTHISMQDLFELLKSGHVTEEDILNRLTL